MIIEHCSGMLSNVVFIAKSFFRKKEPSEGLNADNEPQTVDESLDEPEQTGKKWLSISFYGSLLKNLGKPVSNFLFPLENRYLHRFPEKQRRPIILGIAGAAMLFIILIISIPVSLSGRTRQAAPVRVTSSYIIPAGDLFIPSVPDFLPEFIIEREPRGSWILEDLRPFWRVPENTELWRNEIKSVVDRLMESVP